MSLVGKVLYFNVVFGIWNFIKNRIRIQDNYFFKVCLSFGNEIIILLRHYLVYRIHFSWNENSKKLKFIFACL